MENPIIENNYKEARQKAEELYMKLGRVWSPAIDDYITFTRSGFQHLIWKNGLPRPKPEQRRRFLLLAQVEKILTNPYADFLHEQRGNAQFWSFAEKQDDKTIKIIIRQVGNGEKHFLSIFERK